VLDLVLFQHRRCLVAQGFQAWQVHQFLGKAAGQVAPEGQRWRQGQSAKLNNTSQASGSA
jgi:hypothetical protein